MKKFTLVALALICASTLVFAGGAKESSSEKALTKVRVGIHGNEGGAPLAAVAQEQGFFAKYGIEPVFTIVESGPAEMTAMRADNRTLDVGYIGAGVAWNPIDGGGADPLSFVFLDVLSNAEMLLAKKGIFTDANKNGKYDNSEIYTGLKGRTVYIEVGTTPGGWFKTLLELANEGKARHTDAPYADEKEAFGLLQDRAHFFLIHGSFPPNVHVGERSFFIFSNFIHSIAYCACIFCHFRTGKRKKPLKIKNRFTLSLKTIHIYAVQCCHRKRISKKIRKNQINGGQNHADHRYQNQKNF